MNTRAGVHQACFDVTWLVPVAMYHVLTKGYTITSLTVNCVVITVMDLTSVKCFEE